MAIARYMTLRKGINYLQLISSFHLSRLIGKPILWGQPTTLSIEPTTSCNLRCPECPSGLRSFTRPTGMLQDDIYDKVVNQGKSHLTWLHLYFQGEPFLNPRFLEMVKKADANKIFTSTSTNGHYLKEKQVDELLSSGLKQLIVSVDGVSQEVYEQYRIGGDISTVEKGLRLLLERRKEVNQNYPRVVLQFLVTGQNEHELPAIKKWSKDLGVDELQLKTTQIYDYKNGSDLIPKDLGYSRYLPNADGTWRLKKKIENKCWRMWQGAVSTWDGKIVPCCFDKDAAHVMGDLGQSRLSEIWKSSTYFNFRNQLLSDRTEIEICRNCTE